MYGTGVSIGSLHEVVIDCAEPSMLAEFWRALVGGTIQVVHDDWIVLDGVGLQIGFQRVSEVKSVKNRVHLDVAVAGRTTADLVAAAVAAERLGARRVGLVVDEVEGAFQVMLDPEGNEFCLVIDF